MPETTVRDVHTGDEHAWKTLYRGYREFYRLAPDDVVVDRVWSWLHDPAVPVAGLVAERDGALVGLANHRRFHRPSSGSVGVYLDDLFVAPGVRGGGVGRALVEHLDVVAAAAGASVVRWVTAADNAVARRLYDGVATATHWVTYDRAPGA